MTIRGHNSPVMKARNRSAVLKLLLQAGPSTRRDLAAYFGLTPATITNVVHELLAHGLVEERVDLADGRAAVTRKPVPIAVRAGGAFAVGINLGHTAAPVAVVDLNGSIRALETYHYAAREPATAVARLAAAVDRVIVRAAVDPRRVVGIGVGVAGVIDPTAGVIRTHLGLGWQQIALGPLLSAAVGRHVQVINNVQAMTVGERLWGVATAVDDFALVFVGAVVGAGVMIGGQLHRGREAAAGLIGHMQFVPDGPPCSCGSRGCLEALASSLALVAQAEAAIRSGRSSLIGPLAPAATAQRAPASILAAARRGDRLASELLERQAQYIGAAVAALLHLVDPDLVVLLTPVLDEPLSLGGQTYLDLVRQAARDRARLLDVPDERIVVSRFGSDATVRGAAAVVIEEFLETVPFVTLPALALPVAPRG